jgi:hypothetical protein
MKRALACILVFSLGAPLAASASFRPTPSRLPQPRDPGPSSDLGRGGWDTRGQDKWDRALRHCLNDRRQSRGERRRCADMGMPVRR